MNVEWLIGSISPLVSFQRSEERHWLHIRCAEQTKHLSARCSFSPARLNVPDSDAKEWNLLLQNSPWPTCIEVLCFFLLHISLSDNNNIFSFFSFCWCCHSSGTSILEVRSRTKRWFTDYITYLRTLSLSSSVRRMSTLVGVAFPPYTIFHASLGYIIVCIGITAIISRIVIACAKTEAARDKWGRIHRVSGRSWLMGTYLMPVTAIWVKPWDVEWDFVAFFIFSMYITLIAGFACIKIREVIKGARTRLILKVLHGILMFYSWVMLVGAGISFPFRAANRVYNANSTST